MSIDPLLHSTISTEAFGQLLCEYMIAILPLICPQGTTQLVRLFPASRLMMRSSCCIFCECKFLDKLIVSGGYHLCLACQGVCFVLGSLVGHGCVVSRPTKSMNSN